MAEVEGQEKSEQPTGKKLSESREKGMVAKSMEINSLAIFLTGTSLIYLTKGLIGRKLSEFSVQIFSSLHTLNISSENLGEYAVKGVLFFISLIAPILIALVIISLISGYGQVGFRITPKVFMPNFARFNPITGIKNVFISAKSIAEVIKSLLKLVIVSLFAYFVLEDTIKSSAGLIDYSIDEIFNFMVDTAFRLIWKIALVYIAFAATDFFYQRIKHKRSLMMSKQEVQEEHKQMEGDPHIKAKIRSKQLMIARNRMMKDIPKADVVITNPTHYAVALKYELGSKYAPKVLAKGVDEIAQKIKKIAVEHNIPLHEDIELARALYKHCEVGDEIPTNLFKAVAQVLAYIYQLKNSRKRKSIV